MNSQICLTLNKILFPKQFFNIKTLQIYILSDSGFQHQISNRSPKNNLLNLFGEKIFLPTKTKQILFDITYLNKNYQSKRICSFSYQIHDLPLNSKKQSITKCNQNYNDFQFQFSIKLSLELDTDTVNVTDSQFSQICSPQCFTNQGKDQIRQEFNDQFMILPRIYSPKNASSKFLQSINKQNWQIKSQYSPSKKRIYIVNQQEKDLQDIEKRSTTQSQTIESQSVKKSPVRVNHYCHKNHKIQILKIKNEDEGVAEKKVDIRSRIMKKWDGLMEYKNFLLFGGIVGICSAIISTQLLIF